MSKTKKAFTLTELLTVMAIIGLLIGISMPALSAAKKKARETACKATIKSMDTTLEQFRNDQGFYPSSSVEAGSFVQVKDTFKLGAHYLAEALLGADKLGYRADRIYNPADTAYSANVKRSSYLSSDNSITTSTLYDLNVLKNYPVAGDYQKAWNSFDPVITDGLKADESLPFLYYKANSRTASIAAYDYTNNQYITDTVGSLINPSSVAPMFSLYNSADWPKTKPDLLRYFPYYVWDYKTGATNTNTGAGPHNRTNEPYLFFNGSAAIHPSARALNRDSFLIISAGFDQKYGTADDIANVDLTSGK